MLPWEQAHGWGFESDPWTHMNKPGMLVCSALGSLASQPVLLGEFQASKRWPQKGGRGTHADRQVTACTCRLMPETVLWSCTDTEELYF